MTVTRLTVMRALRNFNTEPSDEDIAYAVLIGSTVSPGAYNHWSEEEDRELISLLWTGARGKDRVLPGRNACACNACGVEPPCSCSQLHVPISQRRVGNSADASVEGSKGDFWLQDVALSPLGPCRRHALSSPNLKNKHSPMEKKKSILHLQMVSCRRVKQQPDGPVKRV